MGDTNTRTVIFYSLRNNAIWYLRLTLAASIDNQLIVGGLGNNGGLVEDANPGALPKITVVVLLGFYERKFYEV